MALHSGRREVVKSGCHTLAILSDIQGQGARIAGADGVKVRRSYWFVKFSALEEMPPCLMVLVTSSWS